MSHTFQQTGGILVIANRTCSVIATHPEGQSNWLERDLIEKATARFGLPNTHLVSTYGLVADGALA